MNRWTLWGCAVSATAATALAALVVVTYVSTARPSTPLILLGLLLTSVVVVGGIAALAGRIADYRRGIGDTVNRLATALREAQERPPSP